MDLDFIFEFVEIIELKKSKKLFPVVGYNMEKKNFLTDPKIFWIFILLDVMLGYPFHLFSKYFFEKT
jgi:hypothetical protein